MCGRFAQIESRDNYLSFLVEESGNDIPYDPQPIGRYNVAPGNVKNQGPELIDPI